MEVGLSKREEIRKRGRKTVHIRERKPEKKDG